MADDLRVRITWQNDEASLRAAMQQAQQILQQVQGNAGGAGTVAGAPTPDALASMGVIRAKDPTQVTSWNGAPAGSGQNAGTSTSTIIAPPPTYNSSSSTSGSGNNNQAQYNADEDTSGGGGGKKKQGITGRMGGIFGYFGRSILVRGAFSAVGAVGEAAQQQQQLSDMNRRVGEGVQQWRQFEDSILKVGVGLGATRAQMIELTNTFVSSVGKMGTEQTAQTVRSGMLLAKTMGIAPESVVGFESQTAKFLQGGNTDFNKLGATLYTAVQSGMKGREEEVIKAIEDLTDIVGQRLPDLGDLGGISAIMSSFNATGVQGLMGQRGAQVIGGIDAFLSGQNGSDAQKNIAFAAIAKQRAAAGKSIDVYDISMQMAQGINSKDNLQAMQQLVSGLPGNNGLKAFMLQGLIGGSLPQSSEIINKGALSNMDLAGALKTPPATELTQADKNTELMVDAGRAMQELGEKLVGVVAPAMNILAHNIGLLTAVMGIANIAGINPLSTAAQVGNAGAKLVGASAGALPLAGGPLALAGAGGLLLGGLGSLAWDKWQHPGEATTIDMILQTMFGVKGLPGQVAHGDGGIVDRPTYMLAGENGPEAIIPLAKLLSGRLGGTGNAWEAFANQMGIETAWGSQMYGNNPLNLRPIPGGWGGQVGVSPGGFAMFDSVQSGIEAAAQNYLYGAGHGLYGYGAVQAAAQSGDPGAVARAIEASSWDAGHYGYGNLSNMTAGGVGAGGNNVIGGGTINHELTVTVKQSDGSVEKFKKSLTDRSAITSPNWGVSY